MGERIGKKEFIEDSCYDKALERINLLFDLYDSVEVSFSGGKDSTAVFQLVYQVAQERDRLPVVVHHWDEEAVSQRTEDYVRRVSQMEGVDFRWYCVPIKHRDACTNDVGYWYPWHSDDKKLWVRDLPEEAITSIGSYSQKTAKEATLGILDIVEKHMVFDKTTCLCLGLRADESMQRYRAVAQKKAGMENYVTIRKNHVSASPIYDWTTHDVWTAPAVNGWDYNTSYDLMEMAGISPNLQRVAPPFGEQPLSGLWMWKVCFPEIWEKLQYRVNGSMTASRYANTALYGKGQTVLDYEHINQDIMDAINAHPVQIRNEVLDRVYSLIKQHKEVTEDPILLYAAHPLSGISYNFIYKVAKKGDVKGRMHHGKYTPDKPEYAGIDKAYKKALKEYYSEARKPADL